MSTQALTASRSAVLAAVTYVSSSQTFPTTINLPPIDAGSGLTVAVGEDIRIEATGGSPIIIETAIGQLVGTCPDYGQVLVVAESGAAESQADFWRLTVLSQSPRATLADADETSTIVDATVVAVTEGVTTLSTADTYTDAALITAIDGTVAANNTLVESMVDAALVLANTKTEVELDKLAVTINNIIAALDNAGLYKVE